MNASTLKYAMALCAALAVLALFIAWCGGW
jgi:hypothetical protein